MGDFRQAISDNYFNFTLPEGVDQARVKELVQLFRSIQHNVSPVVPGSSDTWQVTSEQQGDASK